MGRKAVRGAGRGRYGNDVEFASAFHLHFHLRIGFCNDAFDLDTYCFMCLYPICALSLLVQEQHVGFERVANFG